MNLDLDSKPDIYPHGRLNVFKLLFIKKLK